MFYKWEGFTNEATLYAGKNDTSLEPVVFVIRSPWYYLVKFIIFYNTNALGTYQAIYKSMSIKLKMEPVLDELLDLFKEMNGLI
jgi:hypothetical protein